MPLTREPYPWELFKGRGYRGPVREGWRGGRWKIRRSRPSLACNWLCVTLDK